MRFPTNPSQLLHCHLSVNGRKRERYRLFLLPFHWQDDQMAIQSAKKTRRYTLWLRKHIPKQNCHALKNETMTHQRKGRWLVWDKYRQYHTIFVTGWAICSRSQCRLVGLMLVKRYPHREFWFLYWLQADMAISWVNQEMLHLSIVNHKKQRKMMCSRQCWRWYKCE